MDKDKKEPTQIRGTRGSRGARISTLASRGRAEEKSPSPKSSQPTKELPKTESSEQNRGGKNPERGSRIPPRGRNRQNRQNQRKNRRFGQTNRNTRRLERAQNAARNQQRGQRGRFRARRRFFVMRRRPFGRRSLFIAGLPKDVNRFRLSGLLRKEGRLLRCTLLRDRFGNSRGIAFAEMQNPRDAGKVIQKWRGRNVNGNTIFVTFKRNPNRFNYFSRYNRYGNYRQFNNYGRYNSRFQRPYRPRGNRGRGGRGRGRGG